MPKIADRKFYNGAEQRIARLGLTPLWNELESLLTSFDLRVEEKKNANGGAAVREKVDGVFKQAAGWTNVVSGDIDWIKCETINGARVCLGVEIQFSGRSDLMIVDVDHLRDHITDGRIDAGILVVPSDKLGTYLSDRGPKFSDAVRAIKRARADDLPLIVVALDNDGPGPALPKRRTRLGRAEPDA